MKVRRPPWPSSTGSSPPSGDGRDLPHPARGSLFDRVRRMKRSPALRALLGRRGLRPAPLGNARVALARMLLADGERRGRARLVDEAVETRSRPGRRAEDAGVLADRGGCADARFRACAPFDAPEDARSPDPDGRGPCPQRQPSCRGNFLSRRWRRRMRRRPRRFATPAFCWRMIAPSWPRAGHRRPAAWRRATPSCSRCWAIYLQMEDWSRAEQVEAPARDGGRVSLADQLRTGILAGRGRPRRR
jgi:hypothetical protein